MEGLVWKEVVSHPSGVKYVVSHIEVLRPHDGKGGLDWSRMPGSSKCLVSYIESLSHSNKTSPEDRALWQRLALSTISEMMEL